MIGTIAGTLVRQRLTSPMRLVLALTLIGFGVLNVLFTGSLVTLAAGQMGVFAFVMAAGAIGQDVSSGVLTLAFARPLRRAEYVVGRWLGASGLAVACVVLQVLAGAMASALRHGDPTPMLVVVKLLEGALAVAGTSAVLVMFSSLVPGLGDLGLLLVASLAALVSQTAGAAARLAWLARAGQELSGFLGPTVDLGVLLGAGSVSWFGVVSYLSTLAICLAAAIVAVNRKELSYAAG